MDYPPPHQSLPHLQQRKAAFIQGNTTPAQPVLLLTGRKGPPNQSVAAMKQFAVCISRYNTYSMVHFYFMFEMNNISVLDLIS